ncbi:fumarylacetoacetate hydrolase family protein [Pollutibacter soli]|uniref:fumarylacetoacetate hydrolase family protein n=1 Tax=Pollutibacter soli TaxID=3034157 RepID=UPI003013B0A2
MKLYRTKEGIVVHYENGFYLLKKDWDETVNSDEAQNFIKSKLKDKLSGEDAFGLLEKSLLPPIGSQEVWAAGVTYLRSRDARKEEAAASGGADLYDKVYEAERPELFFKSLPHRVQGHNQDVYIRKDSNWNVPEPEFTLFINPAGDIAGYTIGNDMSSRSIEGENALYLPQAKVYEKSAAIGPCLYLPGEIPRRETKISMKIFRAGKIMYNDSTTIGRMKRTFPELVEYLFREFDFPYGVFLMTGTCLVPGNDFTLAENDIVEISIDGIGMLRNRVAIKK